MDPNGASSRRWATRAAQDTGASLVEYAIIAPLLFLIIVGILEFGVAFRDYSAVKTAASEGARVAAFIGDDADADCSIVQSVAGLLGGDVTRISRIEIFRADTAGAPIPADTNVWSLVGDPTDCVYGWSKTETWPATTRSVTYSSASSLDIIGVRVVMNRSWITGMPPFSGGYDVDESTIMRMEPEGFA